VDARARGELNDQLRRLGDGDRSAFAPAYAALWPLVRAFCRKMVVDQDVDDAAQLTLVKVFERAASFDATRDALPWVLSIAAWECRSLRKKRARSRETSDAHDEAASDESPEQRYVDAELAAAVHAVLGELSKDDRDTLERTMAEEAPQDIAAATFRKRRERALTRLKNVWRRVHGDG
jgi:RNA polymerase sigma-70 factor (ECF subfamily)